MAEYTPAEMGLIGKWWGKDDLAQNEIFWLDVMMTLGKEEKIITLPLVYSPQAVRRIHSMLVCHPGKCGDCCRYQKIPITEVDTKNIVSSGIKTADEMAQVIKFDKEIGAFLDGSKGCPFLIDNTCSVYEHRPNCCWLFPVMGEKLTLFGGKMMNLLQMRLKCPSTIDIARTIISESIIASKGNLILLPDLSLIQKVAEKEESKVS